MDRTTIEQVRRTFGRIYFNSYTGLFALCTGVLLWKHLWGWSVFTAIATCVAWILARGHEVFGRATFSNAARVILRAFHRDD